MTNFDKCKEMLTLDVFTDDKTLCDMIDTMRKCTGNCTECYTWLKKEYKPQILDKAEKKYLSNIVRPFRDKVAEIVKCEGDAKEYIKIELKNESGINLPFFAKGSMYKGMELDKKYFLEELGL